MQKLAADLASHATDYSALTSKFCKTLMTLAHSTPACSDAQTRFAFKSIPEFSITYEVEHLFGFCKCPDPRRYFTFRKPTTTLRVAQPQAQSKEGEKEERIDLTICSMSIPLRGTEIRHITQGACLSVCLQDSSILLERSFPQTRSSSRKAATQRRFSPSQSIHICNQKTMKNKRIKKESSKTLP